MTISFYKYHGTGNDFILVDNRRLKWKPATEQLAVLCDRHFGIGADGMMLLEEREGYDFGMTYFNSDGKESTLCGNGGRCISAYARMLGISGNSVSFMAVDGPHRADILSYSPARSVVSLQMKDAEIEKLSKGHFFTDTGSPHYVILSKGIDRLDVVKEARKIRYDTCFAEAGTNVDFVEPFTDHIFVRSYERGVENETLSCGTGVTASALVFAASQQFSGGTLQVRTKGGTLSVSFSRNGLRFSDIRLEGEAMMVFSGEIGI
jgi:diaminopimelate epimerase